MTANSPERAELPRLEDLHGFLLVDKPEGITSQDVITRLQNALKSRYGRRKRELPKMGHGGTLDPFATGLLIVAVGDAVKLTRYLLGSEKEYEAEAAFGERTASGDRTNEVVEEAERLPASAARLAETARTFLLPPYLQTPPMYSAKKIEGTRLYELARKGLEIEREAVPCLVRELVLTDHREGVRDPIRHPPSHSIEKPGPRPGVVSMRFRARVSAGTFVRTLAEDWAVRAGSLAHLTSLRRTASGPHRIGQARPLADLERDFAEGRLPCADDASSRHASFVPFHRALEGLLPALDVPVDVARRIFAGETRALHQLELPRLKAPSPVALYSEARLVAVVREAEENGGVRLPRVIERGFPLRFDAGAGNSPGGDPGGARA